MGIAKGIDDAVNDIGDADGDDAYYYDVLCHGSISFLVIPYYYIYINA